MWNLLYINLHNLTHLWRKKNSVFRFVCGGCLEGFGGGWVFSLYFSFWNNGINETRAICWINMRKINKNVFLRFACFKKIFHLMRLVQIVLTTTKMPGCSHYKSHDFTRSVVSQFLGSLRLPKKADYLHIREKARERPSTRQRTVRLLTGSKEHSIAYTITSKNQFSILLVKIN